MVSKFDTLSTLMKLQEQKHSSYAEQYEPRIEIMLAVLKLGCNQFLKADWKMKTAAKAPTNPVDAKATVGKGVVSPKFCKANMSRDLLRLLLSTNITNQ